MSTDQVNNVAGVDPFPRFTTEKMKNELGDLSADYREGLISTERYDREVERIVAISEHMRLTRMLQGIAAAYTITDADIERYK